LYRSHTVVMHFRAVSGTGVDCLSVDDAKRRGQRTSLTPFVVARQVTPFVVVRQVTPFCGRLTITPLWSPDNYSFVVVRLVTPFVVSDKLLLWCAPRAVERWMMNEELMISPRAGCVFYTGSRWSACSVIGSLVESVGVARISAGQPALPLVRSHLMDCGRVALMWSGERVGRSIGVVWLSNGGQDQRMDGWLDRKRRELWGETEEWVGDICPHMFICISHRL
jgi:hypothetical protein